MYRYAPRRLRLNESLIAVMLCGTPGVIAALEVGRPWSFLILGMTMVVAALAVHRAFRLALEVTSERVTVHNYWRTYEFGWLEVTKIGLGEETMGVLPQPAIAFGLRGGRIIRAQATPFHPAQQQDIFEALARAAPPSVEFFVPVRAREADRVT